MGELVEDLKTLITVDEKKMPAVEKAPGPAGFTEGAGLTSDVTVLARRQSLWLVRSWGVCSSQVPTSHTCNTL